MRQQDFKLLIEGWRKNLVESPEDVTWLSDDQPEYERDQNKYSRIVSELIEDLKDAMYQLTSEEDDLVLCQMICEEVMKTCQGTKGDLDTASAQEDDLLEIDEDSDY